MLSPSKPKIKAKTTTAIWDHLAERRNEKEGKGKGNRRLTEDEEQHRKQKREEEDKAEARENETQRERETERKSEGEELLVDKEEVTERRQGGDPSPGDSAISAETQDSADEPLPVIVVRTNGGRNVKENGATDIPFSEKRKRKAPMSNGNIGESISVASRRSSRLRASDQDVSKEPMKPVARHSSIASVIFVLTSSWLIVGNS
jgi:hypothetical protein